jgi:hypothetical protein
MRTFLCILLLLSIGPAAIQVSSAAENSEAICINPKDDPPGPNSTAACYTDGGCALIESLGAEPVRDYDVESAPFALARGKISAIVTASKDLIKTSEANGAKCRPAKK